MKMQSPAFILGVGVVVVGASDSVSLGNGPRICILTLPELMLMEVDSNPNPHFQNPASKLLTTLWLVLGKLLPKPRDQLLQRGGLGVGSGRSRGLRALMGFTASGKKGNPTTTKMRTVWNCTTMAGMMANVAQKTPGSVRSPRLPAQPSEGHCLPPTPPCPSLQRSGN